MEDFYSRYDELDLKIHSNLKNVYSLCEEIFFYSETILLEFLKFLLSKYSGNILVKVDAFTQTESTEAPKSDWNECGNIAEEVAKLAKENLLENGFVYEETSGLYYDSATQCYYNPQSKLYYYRETNSYYYYDEETKGLKFYSLCSEVEKTNLPQSQTAPLESSETKKDEQHFTDLQNGEQEVTCVRLPIADTTENDSLEEGEIVDTSDEEEVPNVPAIIESGPRPFKPDHSRHKAPCLRVIVKASSNEELCPGTLFIVTCTGGTIGRERARDVPIPDDLVSKTHAGFDYVFDSGRYYYRLVDRSKNGTYLDGVRMSKKVPVEVTHGSIIGVGSTELICHIHEDYESCSECNGVVKRKPSPEPEPEQSLSERHAQERLMIRKKFGLEAPSKTPANYQDRADKRRKTVGSSHDSEKTEMASEDTPIDQRNKGFKLMGKMGWKEGEGLGKQDGILEPIQVQQRPDKLGLGFGSQGT